MLPEQPISYPEFVADQLLTADNLTDLFHYLDVQERGTRINLIGIGIVCGLEVSVNEEGTELTISKGCGITSEGYLVRWEEASFQNFKPYDAAVEKRYPLFYSGGAQKVTLDELKRDASEEGLTKLTQAGLEGKVVLLYVELLRLDAKNCDPESCDDKGGNVKITFRPLLLKATDVPKLNGKETDENFYRQSQVSLPLIKMPRHHLPAEDLMSTGDVLEGFLQTLTAGFIKSLAEKLSQAYTQLFPLVKKSYPQDPFKDLAKDFAFLDKDRLSTGQLLYIQYYYDFFSDLIAAYEELRQLGMELLSLCCPDEQSFPQHLLLGLAKEEQSMGGTLAYRQYFIPSPAVCCHADMAGRLRFLFTRLVLLQEHFLMPGSESAFEGKRSRFQGLARPVAVRVTPSKMGPFLLSEKAIPFYYDVAAGERQLYLYWNYLATRNGSAHQLLSYHAVQYNSTNALGQAEDQVIHPLKYDLEPYNFLRIEGHVGRRYTDALAAINKIRDDNRLPFEVVALNADMQALRQQLAVITESTSRAALLASVGERAEMNCHFQDLEALYDTMAQGLICQLCQEMKYYYGLSDSKENNELMQPQVPLLKKCDPSFRYKNNSYGAMFEAFYKKLPAAYIEPEQFLGGFLMGNSFSVAGAAAGNNNGIFLLYALLYYMEKLSEILPASLSGFSIAAFVNRYEDLMTVAKKIKEFLQAETGQSGDNDKSESFNEDVSDHLDALLYACQSARFIALYNDYKLRWIYLSMLQKFGYYARQHPGFQHKAGVTMGGTFILVYHERMQRIRKGNSIFSRVKNADKVQHQMAEEQPREAADNIESYTGTKTLHQKKKETPAEDTAVPLQEAKQQMQVADNLEMQAPAAKSGIRQLPLSKLKSALSDRQKKLIDKLYRRDVLTKRSLDELAASLNDKVVIADFYLPYICCSDCPPVSYIIQETETPPEENPPRILLEQKEYCNKDEGSYDFRLTPEGGRVKGEGVERETESGNFVFRPLGVVLAETEAAKDVVLTYTVNGQEAQLTVKVFQQPSAEFTIRDVVVSAAPQTRIFTAENIFEAGYEWDFGDGGKATENPVTHSYEQPGKYAVQLTATNGPCSNSTTQEVEIIKQPSEKSCGPLSDIMDLFNNFPKLNKNQFKIFKEIYNPFYDQIASFFDKLNNVKGKPAAEQIDFFVDNKISDLLDKWFTELESLAQESDVRQMALALWRILLQLAMYLMCIQKGDLGKGKIDLSQVFKGIIESMSGWANSVKNFSATEKAQLQLMLNDINAEMQRIKDNGEESSKKEYLIALQNLADMLEGFLK